MRRLMPSSRATGANRIAAVGKARQAREEREAAEARAAQERDIERRRRRGGDDDLASENVSKCGFEPKPELVALLTSLHVILHPFVDYRGNVEIILLNHHQVAVAADASVLQADMLGLDTGLVEVLRGAVIINLMI